MSITYPDLPDINFPDSYDIGKFFRDPTITEKSLIVDWNALIAQKRFTEADALITANPTLLECFSTASDWNKSLSICIALERFFRDNVENYIINAIKNKGTYSPTTQYTIYNLVTYTSTDPETGTTIDAYIAIKDNVPIGTLPTNSTYFTPVTQRGQMGASGIGLSFRSDWSSTKSFYAQDVVLYNNILWIAKQDNINSVPSEESPNWGVFFYLRIYSNGVITPDNKTLEQNTIITAFDNPYLIAGTYITETVAGSDYISLLKWTSNNKLIADKTDSNPSVGVYNSLIRIYKSDGVTVDKTVTLAYSQSGNVYTTNITQS
ncbi:MAG: hypothetical protein PHC75_08665 [Burkholderiales bacterium]|nr:hypothetical protein [Burkholderiales bacterium]